MFRLGGVLDVDLVGLDSFERRRLAELILLLKRDASSR